VLTVGVRWIPLRTDGHGTVVAWPASTDGAGTRQLRYHLACGEAGSATGIYRASTTGIYRGM